jgi:hypothetical protein
MKLVALLADSEGHFLERKKSYHTESVKEALVAFANSVPEDQQAVLFIGVGPDGKVVGVENADKCQRDVSNLARESCYPPVPCKPTVIKVGSHEVVAVVVYFSKERPHFAAHAFVRIGSQTKKASASMYDDMIASRNDKARRILHDKNQLVTTVWKSKGNPGLKWLIHSVSSSGRHPIPPENSMESEETKECRVESCDAHCVRFFELETGDHLSAALENISIEHDEEKGRTRLIIDNR